MNQIENISIDTLHSIDKEREVTMADPQFQKWCKAYRIGIMVQKRTGIDNANDMMAQWTKQAQSEIQWMPDFIRRMY